MTDEDVQKIQAIADGLNAAICDAWPALIGHRLGSVGSMPDYVQHLLRQAVTRLRNAEARAEAERKRAADLKAAQAARPDHAQQARDGSWWWLDGRAWTNGLDRATRPPEGVRWRATIGDGTRAHVIDGGSPLCGRSAWSGLRLAGPDVPRCVLCQRAADREAAKAPPASGSRWRHFKGNLYRVVRVVDGVVHYVAEHDGGEWTRPVAEWHEPVERPDWNYSGPRFVEVTRV